MNLINYGKILPDPVKKRARKIYGMFPSSIRYGKTFEKTYNFLQESQWWSKDKLEEYQLQELNNLLNHAYENVPYYKRILNERGLKPRDIQDFKDLKELPYLTKDDFKNNFKDLIARNVDLSKLSIINTSGTTGKPLQFYSDSDSDQKELASIFHQWSRVGFHKNDFRVEIRGKVIKEGDAIQFDPISKVIRVSPLMNNEMVEYYLKKLKKFNVEFIHGYPSSISHFAYIIKQKNLDIPFKLKAILFASESVYDWERSIVEEVFDCRAFSHYGMAERAVLAGECEKSYNYHGLPQYGITEIDSKTNEIIGTGFINYITPFIRYRTTDIASQVISCDCEREYYPVFKGVEGRIEDYIITRDTAISPAIITHPFKNLENIKSTQIIQESMDTVILRVVPWNENVNYQNELEKLKNDLEDIMKGIEIEVEEVNEIELTKSGKFKWIISKVSNNMLEKGLS